MRARATLLFWATTAAATVFLGTAWNTAAHAQQAPANLGTALVFALAATGFTISIAVAGRIALVAGRIRRQTRDCS